MTVAIPAESAERLVAGRTYVQLLLTDLRVDVPDGWVPVVHTVLTTSDGDVERIEPVEEAPYALTGLVPFPGGETRFRVRVVLLLRGEMVDLWDIERGQVRLTLERNIDSPGHVFGFAKDVDTSAVELRDERIVGELAEIEHVVIRVRSGRERLDWSIPAVQAPFRAALQAFARGRPDEAGYHAAQALNLAFAAPELLPFDRRRLFDAVREELEGVAQQAPAAFSALWGLDDVMAVRGMTVEQAEALGPLSDDDRAVIERFAGDMATAGGGGGDYDAWDEPAFDYAPPPPPPMAPPVPPYAPPPPPPPPPADDVPEPATARLLLADVTVPDWPGGEVAVARTFVAGQRHRVALWIGHPEHGRPTTIANPDAVPENQIVTEGSFTPLDVTLAHRQTSATKRVYLPSDRLLSSDPAEFDLHVAAGERIVSATVTVSQHGRLIQQSALLGVVTATPDEDAGARIELQTEVLARSPEHPPPAGAEGLMFDVALAEPGGDAPTLLLEGPAARVVAPWDEGVRRTVEVIAESLFGAARSLAVQDDDDAWHALLRTLVAQGNVLLSWLRREGYGALVPARRIQLFSANPTKPTPVELVYDRGPVTADATPCAGWDEALASGTCPVCGPPPEVGASPTICPTGFWGLTKVIERQTGVGDGRPPGSLTPLATVQFAASDEVDEEDTGEALEAFRNLLGQDPFTATGWDQWVSLARDHSPTLIVLLPHQGFDAQVSLDFLEIGRASRLRAGEVRAAMVRPRDDGPDPIVLLLGCRTANASITYQNFVGEFRQNGAAIVVGTLSTVLGRDAAPIAQQFVTELAGLGASTGFGEVMRDVRRKMVAGRNAAALGLIAFGDSEWALTRGA